MSRQKVRGPGYGDPPTAHKLSQPATLGPPEVPTLELARIALVTHCVFCGYCTVSIQHLTDQEGRFVLRQPAWWEVCAEGGKLRSACEPKKAKRKRGVT